MIRGLYTSAGGMLADMTRLDEVANNLANVNTPGFKSTQVNLRQFPVLLVGRLGRSGFTALGPLGTGVTVSRSWTDFAQGSLRHTGHSLDLAIEGEGFFAVQTPAGIQYTRRGDFTLDAQGHLVTQSGNFVLGTNGQPLTLPAGRPQISGGGTVTVGGKPVGQIQLVSFANQSGLARAADGNFVATAASGPPTAATGRIRQGFLEESNTDLVRTTSQMLEAFRAYEANQQALMTQKTTLDAAVNQVGKV